MHMENGERGGKVHNHASPLSATRVARKRGTKARVICYRCSGKPKMFRWRAAAHNRRLHSAT